VATLVQVDTGNTWRQNGVNDLNDFALVWNPDHFGRPQLAVWMDQSRSLYQRFIATALGYLSALVVARWEEIQEKKREALARQVKRARALGLVIAELESNLRMAKEIREYLSRVDSMSDQDLYNRKRDALFDRLQTNFSDALWEDVVQTVTDSEIVKELSNLYRELRYSNSMLEQASAYVSSCIRVGDVPASYKTGIRSQPWRNQLNNVLAEIEQGGESLLPKLRQFHRPIRAD